MNRWQLHSLLPVIAEELAFPIWIEIELLLVPVLLFMVPFSIIAVNEMGRSPETDHVSRKLMAINLHRLLGVFKLYASSLDGQLDLLPEHFALVGVMRW